MERLEALTPEELTRAESRLRNPAPGGKIEAAREFGIDLNSVIEQLRLTPNERLVKLQSAATQLKSILGTARWDH